MKLTQMQRTGYMAYEVPEQVRCELARRFPPKYPDFIGHHITQQFGVENPGDLMIPHAMINVVGYAEEDGLEALVVSVNGSKRREDGKTYHITWSLDRSKGKKPVMSNDLIMKGWTHVEPYKFTAPLKFFS